MFSQPVAYALLIRGSSPGLVVKTSAQSGCFVYCARGHMDRRMELKPREEEVGREWEWLNETITGCLSIR